MYVLDGDGCVGEMTIKRQVEPIIDRRCLYHYLGLTDTVVHDVVR